VKFTVNNCRFHSHFLTYILANILEDVEAVLVLQFKLNSITRKAFIAYVFHCFLRFSL